MTAVLRVPTAVLTYSLGLDRIQGVWFTTAGSLLAGMRKTYTCDYLVAFRALVAIAGTGSSMLGGCVPILTASTVDHAAVDHAHVYVRDGYIAVTNRHPGGRYLAASQHCHGAIVRTRMNQRWCGCGLR